ncbi:hypothetical protein D9611_000039 [Ephemerocybe angulata]|uniref:Uncharacterized protein n=1 Tax=Ephemerocybe angulata TaxID=980116 RepID=A0A8H5BN44_9AGAR|nr:hypothetical protein D9611_000039 [Tulosesus angulatus]
MSPGEKARETTEEWELPNHQRGLVDDIVEESQYEAAIAVLSQLRSPQYKPAVSHIRQLIFLSLHPLGSPVVEPEPSSVTETPKKSKLAKAATSIDAKDIVSARDLLTFLINTNSPEALGRALPSYASQESIQEAEEHLDSPLAKQAACLKNAKHCWELLEENFVFRNQVVVSPKGKSKLRRNHSIEEAIFSGSPSSGTAVVADEAWPFLEWLISLFEKNEDVSEQKDGLRYSPLFLEQLPLPRGGSVTRWDFSIVINVILYSFEQEDSRRQMIGFRLMKLLNNLSNTIYVEHPLLVNSVYKSLLVALSDPRHLQDILSGLGASPSCERFKISFYMKLLGDVTTPPASLQQANIRPRPQTRPAPKPRMLGTSDVPKNPVPEPSSSPQGVASKYILPPSTEVLQCVEAPRPQFLPKPFDDRLIFFAKFQLVNSFASLQELQSPEVRLEWDRSIQDGKVAACLKRAFPPEGGDEASMYLQMLHETLRIAT